MSQICPLRLVVQQLITEDKCGYIVETRLYVVFLSLNDCFGRKPFYNNDRNQVLWASETEHPTQALTFTKTAGRQPGWGHCYVRSSALSSTMVLVKGVIVMLNSSSAKNEKETGSKLAFAKSSGIVTGDATVSYWPICLCEIKVNSGQFPSRFNSRELKQQRQWRLRKRHLKGTVKSQNGITALGTVALLQTLPRLFHLVQFVKCWQFFVELNSKRLYESSGKEK